VAGALAMMANWDLRELVAALPRLAVPLYLLTAAGDKAVPPSQGPQRAARLVPKARCECWPSLGHLAHEEDPQQVFDTIAPLLTKQAS
jgi:magnesium chelatase accessory protein